jgi:hypothetical protein
MATIVTRAGKGSALTWTEGDANFTNLNDDKIERVSDDFAPQLAGNLDVDGNSITTTEVNGDITLAPNGDGIVTIVSDLEVGYGTSIATITSAGAHNLDLVTNGGTNSGIITIHDGVNGNIDITPNGTGQTVMKNIEYNEFIHSLGTTSGTITPDVANGNVQTITLNGNLTFSAFSNPITGQSLTLIINTNGTSRTLTSTMKFAGASKTLSTTNTTDIISVFYDGTNYWASLAKGFA